MEPAVLVSIIASTTSGIVAIISLISAQNAGKVNGEMQKEIELLRFDIEQKRNNSAFKFKLTEKQIVTIDKIISGIQELKEILDLATTCSPGSYASKAFQLHIDSCVDKIKEIYIDGSMNLDAQMMKMAHDLKNVAISLDIYCRHFMKEGKFVNLTEEQRIELKKVRGKISDKQQLLRDARYSLISTEIQ